MDILFSQIVDIYLKDSGDELCAWITLDSGRKWFGRIAEVRESSYLFYYW